MLGLPLGPVWSQALPLWAKGFLMGITSTPPPTPGFPFTWLNHRFVHLYLYPSEPAEILHRLFMGNASSRESRMIQVSEWAPRGRGGVELRMLRSLSWLRFQDSPPPRSSLLFFLFFTLRSSYLFFLLLLLLALLLSSFFLKNHVGYTYSKVHEFQVYAG